MYFYSFEDGPELESKSDMKIQGVNRRKISRTQCLIPAWYRINNEVFISFILDINRKGAFIETDKFFPAGEKILLKYIYQSPRKIPPTNATIKWSKDNAIGVQFD